MYCYRFQSRQQFLDLAAAAGLTAVDGDGNVSLITAGHNHSMDEIGTIWRSGSVDPQTGEMIGPPVASVGWHVNLSGIAPEEWDEFLVAVNFCVRHWFGGPSTVPSDDVLEQA